MGKFMNLIKYTIIAAIILTLILSGNKITHEPEELRSWILSFGLFSPLLYILLCSLRPLILFPFLILTIAGGLAFDAVLGTILTIIGGLIGGSISFFITRQYGDLLKLERRESLRKLEKKIEERGFQYVLILRVLPFLNFDLVSYISGLSSVRYKAYFVATLLGMIPGTIGLNYLGSSLINGEITHIVFILVVLVMVFVVSLLLKRKYKEG